MAPKQSASEWLLGNAELDAGSWSGLDESGPDKLGVGLFFNSNPQDGAIRVISIVPGSAAHKSGLLELHDQLIAVENENVFGWSLKVVRQRVHGSPGSHVTLDFKRERRSGKGEPESSKFRVNLMRGSPQYIAYQDMFGPANASQLDALVLQKREEQKFNSMVEKELKLEQARFAEAQERRRNAEADEAGLREELQRFCLPAPHHAAPTMARDSMTGRCELRRAAVRQKNGIEGRDCDAHVYLCSVTRQQQSRATLTRKLARVRRLQRELFEEEVPAPPHSPISVAGPPSSVSCEQDSCCFSMHRLTLIGVLCQNVFQLHRTRGGWVSGEHRKWRGGAAAAARLGAPGISTVVTRTDRFLVFGQC